MNRKDGQFTGRGGIRLHWQAWEPDGPTRAVLLVAHGYGEHGGRYGNLVDHFLPQGYSVYALDHRGHGRSQGPRGHVGRFGEFVTDLHALRVRIEEEHKEAPLVLVGHSMGGLIAIHYVLDHGPGLAAAVLSSPCLGIPNPPSRTQGALASIFSVIVPRLGYEAKLNPDDLSHEPTVGRAYAADPLVHRRATARFYTEFSAAMHDATERAGEITLPILILQAGSDRLVDPEATVRFCERVASADKKLRVYPALFHEIFNEIERDQVLADLEAWLEPRLTR